MEKRQEEINRLLQLPQEGDMWQLGVEQYVGRWINFAGRVWHPWMAVVYSLTHQTVITNFPFCIDPPTEDFVLSIFWRAVVCPARPATPHRPTELQLRDDAIGHALKPWAERLGIACVLKDKMDVVEKALLDLGREMYDPTSADPAQMSAEQTVGGRTSATACGVTSNPTGLQAVPRRLFAGLPGRE